MKRKRIVVKLPLRVAAIEELAKLSGVGYNEAFAAYNNALKYCKVFNDMSVLDKAMSNLRAV